MNPVEKIVYANTFTTVYFDCRKQIAKNNAVLTDADKISCTLAALKAATGVVTLLRQMEEPLEKNLAEIHLSVKCIKRP